ncbi:uncharacterized protein LOC122563174 isoform X2 [Chiloscyllium plagiosum]|uniref:uncharacterized protein LOC122563174 isoform X2 n=1 Tax=Chiloscyllium plagiosum TaxID=36176 RepID=UPI001CB884C7|nr:uncharacterized protein LOC122563174 isoform X2 [Chiloscyllium plagiosum]
MTIQLKHVVIQRVYKMAITLLLVKHLGTRQLTIAIKENWRDQEETPCNHRQRTMCKKVHINPQPSENQVEANVNEYHDHPAGSLMRSNL